MFLYNFFRNDFSWPIQASSLQFTSIRSSLPWNIQGRTLDIPQYPYEQTILFVYVAGEASRPTKETLNIGSVRLKRHWGRFKWKKSPGVYLGAISIHQSRTLTFWGCGNQRKRERARAVQSTARKLDVKRFSASVSVLNVEEHIQLLEFSHDGGWQLVSYDYEEFKDTIL